MTMPEIGSRWRDRKFGHTIVVSKFSESQVDELGTFVVYNYDPPIETDERGDSTVSGMTRLVNFERFFECDPVDRTGET